MSDPQAVPSLIEDEPVDPIVEVDVHEELWDEIDSSISEKVQEFSLKLATIVAVSGTGGGPIIVQFNNSATPNQLGYAHTMGMGFRVGMRVVVAPLEGGDHVILGALNETEGAHEQVVRNQDLVTDIVDSRVLAGGSVDGTHIQPGAVTGGHIPAGQINSDHIINGSILTRHIPAQQIYQTHLTANIIAGNYIAPGGVMAYHLALDVYALFPSFANLDAKANKDQLDNYVKTNDLDNRLENYVRDTQLAPGAKGNDELATKQWVNSNFKPDKKDK